MGAAEAARGILTRRYPCVAYAFIVSWSLLDFRSLGGDDELPTLLTLAPSAPRLSRPPSISHSDGVSESEKREPVLGGERCSLGVKATSSCGPRVRQVGCSSKGHNSTMLSPKKSLAP